MTTTTRNTLEIDKVVGSPVADPAVDQRGKSMDEAAPAAVPWSKLAPSEYAAMARWSASGIPGEEHQALVTSRITPRQVMTNRREAQFRQVADGWLEERHGPAMASAVVAELCVDKVYLTRAALLAAVLALVETGVALLTIQKKDYVFGLFVSRTAWVSTGSSKESWPGGSIESSLQERLTRTPVKVRDLLAEWIGPVRRPDPWAEMRDRIVNRLVRQGVVKLCQEKRSFLFFSWMRTTHRPTERLKDVLADYASVARRTGLGLPLLDRSLLRLGQRDVISSEIGEAFASRTEVPDSD